MNMIFSTSSGRSETLRDSAVASTPARADGVPPEQSTLADSQIDVGPDWSVDSFKPGRFANAIQKTTNARHALQAIREDMTSSFILNLEPDGSAAVCRGWRYLFFNDGPQIHTTEQIREQLGYRGHWEQQGAWVLVSLTIDDSVCARVAQYGNLVPHHATEWQLRFLPLAPKNHPTLTVPILACQPVNPEPAFGEDEPHIVPGILPGRWLVLGMGNGLRIKLAAHSIGSDEAPDVRVEVSPEPLGTDAWENSF